ncbi:MAG: translation elongation factor Ts [Deltaproteobacteria bacterium]|nr:MAG: translation elongation factor Ts [Deltaproteobacteria bacterium]TMA45832.1 MAG: translation elongation factor Ts [Deltaproteobacteria bacterium]TMA76018.1 MAG: translation elongation factor Ts [Deltaproteobacteria bacterium]TMB34045.1 MAG: translation elongation factor Ts [Deltaproteobacteria bacterium]
MAEVTSAMVKDLREKTGAGMMDCKKALVESSGDVDKAITWLREKGLATAGKKAGRSATEGAVGSYIHLGGKIGVLVEVNCETDFTARNEKFQALVKDIAMQIAWSNPRWLRREEVPAAELDQEKSVHRAQLREQGKPEAMLDKIIPGKIEKFYKEYCLLEQAFFRDPEGKRSVQDEINAAIAIIGENMQVRRFTRYALGEGLKKEQKDFAAEVSAAVSGQK